MATEVAGVTEVVGSAVAEMNVVVGTAAAVTGKAEGGVRLLRSAIGVDQTICCVDDAPEPPSVDSGPRSQSIEHFIRVLNLETIVESCLNHGSARNCS